ncbi:hypothetical protein [Brevundimonas sp. DC300-4]|uniref:hypothetical protein n=1 Tax=Brevundimonas sp. DC300-4 TaxID=2804594 RepID=UPI003CF1EEF7
MSMNENLQNELQEVFSLRGIAVRSTTWSGQALFLGTDFVIRQHHRMKGGKIIHLNLPNSSLYELRACQNSWFISGHCDGKRVIVHVFREEVLACNPGTKPAPVLALHLIVMVPSVGAEMMERFGADEGASIQFLMPWTVWTEIKADLDADDDVEPWLDGPDPVDLTSEPVIASFAERG